MMMALGTVFRQQIQSLNDMEGGSMPWSLRSDLTLKSFLTNRKLWLGLFIFELVVLAALPVTRELFSYIVNNGFSHQYYK